MRLCLFGLARSFRKGPAAVDHWLATRVACYTAVVEQIAPLRLRKLACPHLLVWISSILIPN